MLTRKGFPRISRTPNYGVSDPHALPTATPKSMQSAPPARVSLISKKAKYQSFRASETLCNLDNHEFFKRDFEENRLQNSRKAQISNTNTPEKRIEKSEEEKLTTAKAISVPAKKNDIFCGMKNLMLDQNFSCQKLPPFAQQSLHFLLQVDLPPGNEKFQPISFESFKFSKPFLVLDLDETLVHCTQTVLRRRKPELKLEFKDETTKQTTVAHVYARPFLFYFLREVSKKFEVAVFTASTANYADQVLNYFSTQGCPVVHRFYREHCTHHGGCYMKNLANFGRDLRKTVLVDNSPASMAFQLDNGIPVSTWTGEANDLELITLIKLLKELALADDFSHFLSRRFGLKDWVNFHRAAFGRCGF
eukprot:GHVP01040450.1.p1 GENE.GHVP01040450.1~~GHVP01040450.1.p1  ORF type:complete len:362 (+),score=59.27 GHVP01040450.1:1054-2139(+)